MIEKMKMMEKTVPTDLCVKVDGKHEVFYKRLDNCFGYEFRVFPKSGALEAVEQIVEEMESQSYDHGASWRKTSLEEVQREDEFDMYKFFEVKFRVRDAW